MQSVFARYCGYSGIQLTLLRGKFLVVLLKRSISRLQLMSYCFEVRLVFSICNAINAFDITKTYCNVSTVALWYWKFLGYRLIIFRIVLDKSGMCPNPNHGDMILVTSILLIYCPIVSDQDKFYFRSDTLNLYGSNNIQKGGLLAKYLENLMSLILKIKMIRLQILICQNYPVKL